MTYTGSRPIPILRQGDRLIVSVYGELTDSSWAGLIDDLLGQVRSWRATGVVLDVSGVEVMDSYAARTITGLAHMVGLLGATMVISGIGPAVAFTMVQLGATLGGARTAIDLDEALSLLDQG